MFKKIHKIYETFKRENFILQTSFSW